MMEDLDKSGEIVGLEFLFAKSIDLGMLCPTIAKNLKINFIK